MKCQNTEHNSYTLKNCKDNLTKENEKWFESKRVCKICWGHLRIIRKAKRDMEKNNGK